MLICDNGHWQGMDVQKMIFYSKNMFHNNLYMDSFETACTVAIAAMKYSK